MKNGIIEDSIILQKLLLSFKLISIGTPFLLFVEKYIFSDWDYLIGFMLLVGLNTVTGSIAAAIAKEFSTKLFYKKLGLKIFGITIVLAGVGILKKLKIDGDENYLSDIIDAGIYSLMGGLEFLKMLKNAYRIYPHQIIRYLIELIESWYFKQVNRLKNEDKPKQTDAD